MPKRDDEKQQQEKELQDLWQRRDALDEREWTRLYNLIYFTLSAKRGCLRSLLNDLPEDFDFYAHDFLERKVFLPTRREDFVAGTLEHSGALHKYFRRFLLDRLDENEHQPENFSISDESTQAPEVIGIIISNERHLDLPDPDWRPSPEQAWWLWDVGLDLTTVIAIAKDFINRLTPEDHLLFKECFVEGKPLSSLKGRVKNVYEAAAKLGIKLRKDEKKFVEYRNTRVGFWLTQPLDGDPPGLGLSLGADQIDVVFMIVFEILPACALDGVDVDRRSGSGPDDPPPDAGPTVSHR